MTEIRIHPLQQARKKLGIKQQVLADLTGLSIATIKRAEKGETISLFSISQICQYFSNRYNRSVEAQELGLQNQWESENTTNQNLPILESNGFFSFGKIETALVILDGNGTETYSPQNIRTFYDFRPIKFCEEIEQTREIIMKEQAQNEINGKPFQWNGDIYHLAKHVLSRDPIHEHMKLNLWFHPTDYYTILAKNRCLKGNTFQEKYITDDWETPLYSLPIPFGIGLSLLTTDGYILFTQRGSDLGVRPGHFMTSVEEGLSRPLDRSTVSDAPDVYRCACRGLSEELGLIENSDFSVSDILFLALGLDTEYYMCGLRGLIKSSKTAHEIIKNWQIGVKDKLENKKLFAIPFTPKDVCEFVFSHGPWGGGALMGIYHTLIHEFGKEQVNIALAAKKT
jgi:transcriptional regulator with XRE-family HTH domain